MQYCHETKINIKDQRKNVIFG